MKIRKVTRKVAITRPSLEEIRRDNRGYFDALAKEFGRDYAAEVERQYMEEVSKELESMPQREEVEIPMIEIQEKEDPTDKRPQE